MATKKPMKFKRYDIGGEVDESTAKQRGLDISNKEKPVGFFERIRMGNIDEPGSEAYNRFGAGRGRASAPAPAAPAAPATPSMPAASSRPLSDDMYSDTGSSTGMGAARTSETVKPTRQVMTKPTLPASKPTPTASKPTASSAPAPRLRDTGPARGDLINKPSLNTNYSNEGRSKPAPSAPSNPNYSNEGRSRPAPAAPAKPSMNVPEMRDNAKKALADDPTALLGTGAGAAAAAMLARSKLGKLFKGAKKAGKKDSPYLKELPMEKKKLGRAASDVTDVVAKKRGGAVKKYASGGMVSSASKRADGIASKGKTRCKIC